MFAVAGLGPRHQSPAADMDGSRVTCVFLVTCGTHLGVWASQILPLVGTSPPLSLQTHWLSLVFVFFSPAANLESHLQSLTFESPSALLIFLIVI